MWKTTTENRKLVNNTLIWKYKTLILEKDTLLVCVTWLCACLSAFSSILFYTPYSVVGQTLSFFYFICGQGCLSQPLSSPLAIMGFPPPCFFSLVYLGESFFSNFLEKSVFSIDIYMYLSFSVTLAIVGIKHFPNT